MIIKNNNDNRTLLVLWYYWVIANQCTCATTNGLDFLKLLPPLYSLLYRLDPKDADNMIMNLVTFYSFYLSGLLISVDHNIGHLT